MVAAATRDAGPGEAPEEITVTLPRSAHPEHADVLSRCCRRKRVILLCAAKCGGRQPARRPPLPVQSSAAAHVRSLNNEVFSATFR
jgi:hypothetical protein